MSARKVMGYVFAAGSVVTGLVSGYWASVGELPTSAYLGSLVALAIGVGVAKLNHDS